MEFDFICYITHKIRSSKLVISMFMLLALLGKLPYFSKIPNMPLISLK